MLPTSLIFILAYVLVAIKTVDAYSLNKNKPIAAFRSKQPNNNNNNKLYFKKADDNNKDSSSSGGFLQGLKRFLPWTSKSVLQETYDTPKTDTGMRYHLRLRKPELAIDDTYKRHVITRIIRYFPDIVWETAEGIVKSSLEDEVALLRVLNSKVCTSIACLFVCLCMI